MFSRVISSTRTPRNEPSSRKAVAYPTGGSGACAAAGGAGSCGSAGGAVETCGMDAAAGAGGAVEADGAGAMTGAGADGGAGGAASCAEATAAADGDTSAAAARLRTTFRFTARRVGCNNGARNFGHANLELCTGTDNENDSPYAVGNRRGTPRPRSSPPRLARTRAPARTRPDGRLRSRGALAHRFDHKLPGKVRRETGLRLRSLHRPRSLPCRARA